jgi:hypothetical protein
MDQSLYIKLGTLFWIVQAIPESVTGNTVMIEIRRLSDSYTWNFTTLAFESGNNTGAMTFVSGIIWKASFTPPTQDTYIITITNTTLDIKYVQTLLALNQATPIQSVTAVTTVTSATLLAAVEQAIAARLNGGAVQSYAVGGRNLQYMSIEALMKMRDQLKAEVSSSSGGARNFVSFENPS